MEDIKPTRVNYVSGGRTDWVTGHVATSTYRGKLARRQGAGGVQGGRRCRYGVSGGEWEKEGGVSLFDEEGENQRWLCQMM